MYFGVIFNYKSWGAFVWFLDICTLFVYFKAEEIRVQYLHDVWG